MGPAEAACSWRYVQGKLFTMDALANPIPFVLGGAINREAIIVESASPAFALHRADFFLPVFALQGFQQFNAGLRLKDFPIGRNWSSSFRQSKRVDKLLPDGWMRQNRSEGLR